jgi:hypothetical protein
MQISNRSTGDIVSVLLVFCLCKEGSNGLSYFAILRYVRLLKYEGQNPRSMRVRLLKSEKGPT